MQINYTPGIVYLNANGNSALVSISMLLNEV